MKQLEKLILASGSPRRKEMLSNYGLLFEVMPVDIDESDRPDEKPFQFVRRLARDKAEAAAAMVSEGWILAADTVVVLDDLIMGKPGGAEAAEEMLRKLSGKTHQVYTGFTLLQVPGGRRFEDVVCTDVIIRTLTKKEIQGYIASGEPFDKAGGYAIQGLGAFMVQAITGSYSNVVGLPLCEVLTILDEAGVVDLPNHLANGNAG